MEEPDVQSQDAPEGGWAGWATAIGTFLVQFSTLGFMLSFGVFQDFYAQTYITNQTSSTIAWIGSVSAFLFEMCGLLAGKLYDRGYFYHLLYGASILQALSLFMLSLARPDSYYQVFLAQGIGSGCAAGLLYVPSMAVVSQHFNKRREHVMAFASSGAYLGAAAHPILLNNTINTLGFANGVRASATLVTGLLLIACLLMRARLPPSKIHIKFFAVAGDCGKDSAFIFGCLGFAVFIFAVYYPLFYLQLSAMRHGLGPSFSFYSLVIMNVSSFIGQLSSTVIVGCFRVQTALIISTFCCSVILFGMICVKTTAGVVVFGILYGYFSGICTFVIVAVLQSQLIIYFWPICALVMATLVFVGTVVLALWTPLLVLLTPNLTELGVRMGIACVTMAFGSLIGPPISGALLTSAYVWWRGAVFNGIVSLVGCAMFAIMHRILDQRSKQVLAQPMSELCNRGTRPPI